MEVFPGQPLPPFDVEHMKSLSRPELVEALLVEAQEAIQREPESRREAAESNVFDVCWLPSEEEALRRDQEVSLLDQEFGRIASEIIGFETGEELDSAEALGRVRRQTIGNAIKRFGEYKQKMEEVLKEGEVDNFALKMTLYRMCSAQILARMPLDTDYIRKVASEELADEPGVKGIVLIHNACAHDPDSLEEGVSTLKEAMGSDVLNGGQAGQALRFILHYFKTCTAERAQKHKDFLLELLSLMRQDGSVSYYPETVARLAVLFRNLPPQASK